MYLELSDIVVLTVVVIILSFWWNAQAIRQTAIRHAKSRCKQLNLQFLDGSISLNFEAIRRSPNGSLAILRRCQFEFSATGQDRYQGEVFMLGARLQEIRIPPHILP
ncbi:DUF3301 domain-containing protein [Sansalvadorimonas verongulae]|uniref:DUF3301 domain-containing protein n=1 Tax=Sansalvadorimonas verongulae TaxID=2172824 RepID=UPI0012BBE59C|nr:DUF3301 domain-containing protein [Sansalvadorimonas verongulae]MTI12223.1 DUF3301 domain-containing protein [Sansalvadorimonas verongulae]